MFVLIGTSTAPSTGAIRVVHSGIGQSKTSPTMFQPNVSMINCLSSKASQ